MLTRWMTKTRTKWTSQSICLMILTLWSLTKT